ncbi:MAG: N-acetylmuramoyl-L-alanine amidase [Candidatus Rokuibacteriota bacterium]
MADPVDTFFIHHSVTNAPGPSASREEDAAHTRLLQSIAFGRGFLDISYSFIAYRSGRIAEGRGWGAAGAHTQGFNSTSYAVCLAGNYERDVPTPPQIRAVQELIALGKQLDRIKPAVTIRPHRAVSATSCPGANVMAIFDKFGQPPGEEDDVPLTNDEIDKIADAVWSHAIASGGGFPETWSPALHLRTQSAQLRDLLVDTSVDEAAIAAAVLAGLKPATIAQAVAEALGPEVAGDVAAELARRLAA